MDSPRPNPINEKKILLAHRSRPKVVRVVHARFRLFLSILLGLVLLAALPGEWRLATRVLLSWDIAIGFYLILVYSLMARTPVSHIRLHAAIEDEGAVAILMLTTSAAMASLGGILAQLGTSSGAPSRDAFSLALAMTTTLLSWTFIHTIFALHYAHEFYAEDSDQQCMIFPATDKPDYWDFVYFSFVIGMTSQVSDVAVANRGVRRLVAAHGIVSFLFNVALLALTVNIAASAI
jgi:uncharacterized membrane protein